MTKLEQAARLALDVLEDVFGKNKVDVPAITVLREALAAQPALLTDEEINTLWDDSFIAANPTSGNQRFKFARAIEAKIKEKTK
jgi:ribosomal protein L19E